MNKSAEQEEIAAKFAKIKRHQLLALIPVAIVFLLFLVSSRNPQYLLYNFPLSSFPPIGFGIIVAVVIFSLFNWRCPACKGYLGKGGSPKFCPKCGVKLEQ